MGRPFRVCLCGSVANIFLFLYIIQSDTSNNDVTMVRKVRHSEKGEKVAIKTKK